MLARRLIRIRNTSLTPPIAAPSGFPTPVLDEQFATIDTDRWKVYDNSTFGAPTRIQRYMAYNAVSGATPTTDATGGNSLRLKSVRENVGGNTFTAGMLDSKTAGYWLPLYSYVEIRQRIPHGQGLWPAAWLTARVGGATTCEFDMMEYFHSQVPGYYSVTLHRTDNSGTFRKNVSKNQGGTFFEAPTYTPGWNIMASSIEPENGVDASAGVRFKAYLNGSLIWQYLDMQALWWTANGSTDPNAFWNIYLQGCQIDGEWVGHPDDYLGYSAQLTRTDPVTQVTTTGNCVMLSGTAPNMCKMTYMGNSVIRAGAAGSTATITGQDATTYEIDYIRVWSR